MSSKFNSALSRLANEFARSMDCSSALGFRIKIALACQALQYAYRERVYTPAITIWMFLGQVLSPDHGCQDAVSRLNVWRVANGEKPCSTDTSAYCEARMRLPEELLLNLARDMGVTV